MLIFGCFFISGVPFWLFHSSQFLRKFLLDVAKNFGKQKQIEALTAGLQKVSAQLEASKPAQQVAANDQ